MRQSGVASISAVEREVCTSASLEDMLPLKVATMAALLGSHVGGAMLADVGPLVARLDEPLLQLVLGSYIAGAAIVVGGSS